MVKINSYLKRYLIVLFIASIYFIATILIGYFLPKKGIEDALTILIEVLLFVGMGCFITIFIYFQNKKDFAENLQLREKISKILDEKVDKIDTTTDFTIDIAKKIRKLNLDNQKLNYVINSMSQGLILLDHKSNISIINKACLEIFPQGKIGQTIYSIINYPNILQEIKTAHQRIVNSTLEEEINNRNYKISITSIDVGHSSKYPLYWVGLFFSDISLTKELANVKRDFFANASHELKSPLTSIIGYSQMLKEGFLSSQKEKDEAIEAILNKANKMSTIVKQMLSLSKYEFKNNINDIEAIDLNQLCQNIVNELQLEIKNKNIQVEINKDTFAINMNKDDASSLVKNLVENAIKYNKLNGKISIEIASNNQILTIEDTGIGISKDNLNRIFERFYQVDGSKSNQESGIGLGLAIVKHIIESYNFEIKVTSKLAQGTKFTISFKN